MQHELHLDVGLDLGEYEKSALILAASEGLYDPGEVLADELEAHRRLYSDLDQDQQAVLDELRAEGLLE